MNIDFTPFKQQDAFMFSDKKYKGAFAGKRGGKTEVGAFYSGYMHEQKEGYKPNGIDPYLGIIIAPTTNMLKRLSWKKFKAYWKHLIVRDIQSPFEIDWHDGSEILGISADKPERLEGLKASWIWIDEVFQVKEQLYLEALARTADMDGVVICTGSLGVQYINPSQHWAHKYFKEEPDGDTECFEWNTEDNPHFPKHRLEKLRNKLDERTFKQMFEINWDITPSSAVYNNFTGDNIIKDYKYDSKLPTLVSVDWGWAHPMAVGFFQYDKKNNTVYLFDEIISSRLTLDALYQKISNRGYEITDYCCDVAGNQEREQTGISNVRWFRQKGIKFNFRWTAINYGIPIVRSYIKNGKGEIKFKISDKCVKSIQGIKGYRYPEKDGMIQNENPVKVDDDACDMIRYFFVNYLDEHIMNRRTKTIQL